MVGHAGTRAALLVKRGEIGHSAATPNSLGGWATTQALRPSDHTQFRMQPVQHQCGWARGCNESLPFQARFFGPEYVKPVYGRSRYTPKDAKMSVQAKQDRFCRSRGGGSRSRRDSSRRSIARRSAAPKRGEVQRRPCRQERGAIPNHHFPRNIRQAGEGIRARPRADV